VNAETQLFRYRLETDDTSERAEFVGSLNLDWKEASPEETMEARRAFIKDKKHFGEEGSYYKVLYRCSLRILT
jgi:DNA primase large subunit